jgi:hypothetical protein
MAAFLTRAREHQAYNGLLEFTEEDATMHTHINRAGWLVAGVLALFVAAAMTGIVNGGPLDPPGAPSATGTLPQVEPRSPIPPVGWNGTFPIVISQPGSYFFTRSLNGVSSTDGIEIAADNVSLDLNGFTLAGAGQSGNGIEVVGQHRGIRISNGIVRNWYDGIDGWGPSGEATYSRVNRVTAIDNSATGISLGYDSEVTDCNASANSTGIHTHYGVVSGCHATDNAGYGIYGEDVSLIEDNKVWNNAFGIVVSFSAAQPGNNTVRSNTSTNNATADINFNGTGNVSYANVATCPGWVTGAGVVTYNSMFQRAVC